MLYKLLLLSLTILCSLQVTAQQIPLGSCGIVNIYDATGSRTKCTYFCNNGVNPYPQRPAMQTQPTSTKSTPKTAETSSVFQEVDALYPNPTSGRFSISFSKALDKATIQIMDEAGKVVKTITAKGYKVDIDLSANAAGIYFVRITDSGLVITKKVVKL